MRYTVPVKSTDTVPVVGLGLALGRLGFPDQCSQYMQPDDHQRSTGLSELITGVGQHMDLWIRGVNV